MIKTDSLLVCLLCFFVIFAVLGFSCHHCSSLHKTESRQHTQVSTVFNSEALCIQEIHPIRIFSPTVKVLWSLHPNKCFFFEDPHALCWKWAFSTADSTIPSFCCTLWYRDQTQPRKEKAWAQGQISRYPGWYSQLMNTTHLASVSINWLYYPG